MKMIINLKTPPQKKFQIELVRMLRSTLKTGDCLISLNLRDTYLCPNYLSSLPPFCNQQELL